MRLKLREFRKIIREELIRIRLNEADEEETEGDDGGPPDLDELLADDEDDDKDDDDKDKDDVDDDKDEDEDEEKPKGPKPGETDPAKVKALMVEKHGEIKTQLISKQPPGSEGSFKIEIYLSPGPKLPDVEDEENPKLLNWKIRGIRKIQIRKFKKLLLTKQFWMSILPPNIGASEKAPYKVTIGMELPRRKDPAS